MAERPPDEDRVSEESMNADYFEFGWIIGLLEGEGSPIVHRDHRTNKANGCVSLQMTDRDVVERFAKWFNKNFPPEHSTHRIGGPEKRMRVTSWADKRLSKSGTKRKRTYQIRVNGRRAFELMRRICPHMSKRRQKQINSVLVTCGK